MAGNWYAGNAADDGAGNRGWLIGHFMDAVGDVRGTGDVEVKWGIHRAGDTRAEWTVGDQRTTVLILVEGLWRLDLSGDSVGGVGEVRSVELRRPGDYVVWGPGIDHSWRAVEDSVMITVRWPSTPAVRSAGDSPAGDSPADGQPA